METVDQDDSSNSIDGSKDIVKAVRSLKAGMSVRPQKVGSITITAKNFFYDNGEGGYTTKADFLKLLYSLQLGEIIALERALDRMLGNKELGKIKGWKTDQKSREFIRLSYEEDGAEHELKVYITGNMQTFFMLYRFHILMSNISLEQLYYEALNTHPNQKLKKQNGQICPF